MSKRKALFIGEAMIEISGSLDALKLGFGGDILNTAWHMRRLLPVAAWDVALFTATGRDVHSHAMRKFITRSGIDFLGSPELEDYNPGLYIIHQEKGDRQFTYWRTNSAARHLADGEALQQSVVDIDILYFSGITLAILPHRKRLSFLSSIRLARQQGARIAFDPNIRRSLWNSEIQMRSAIADAAKLADIVLPSFADDSEHFNDASPASCAERYTKWGVQEVVVKNGGGPMVAARDGSVEEFYPVRAVDVVDPTGAGDAFNAGYLAARLQGQTIANYVSRGHGLALEVITRHGAIGV